MVPALRQNTANQKARSHASLALCGLGEVDAAVMASMIGLLQGRTAMQWTLTTPNLADFLVVGPEPVQAVLTSWQASGKPWVAVVRSGDARPPTAHTLQLPMRMFPLLTLLEELEDLVVVQTLAPAPVGNAQPVNSANWQFPSLLHQAKLATAYGSWRRAGQLYVRDDASAFACEQADFEALRRGELSLTRFEQSLPEPPANCAKRPIEELMWFIGWWADSQQLAPWLAAHAHHRLRQWPDFGNLQASQIQLRLASMVVARAWTVDELVDGHGFAREQVTRFMNAASLSGLLIESVPAPKLIAPKANGFLARLVENMRSRLGLGGVSGLA